MSVNYNARCVQNGLVLYLDAANKRSYPGSGTVWTDLSGRGNSGTIVNGSTYSSANAGNLILNGTSQYVSCNHPTGSSYGITYEVFLKLNETTDNSILSFNNATYFSGLSIVAGKFIGYLSVSNYKYYYDTTVQSGLWYHIVMYVGSSDAKDIKGYVNGVLDKTATSHTGVAYSPTILYIATSNLSSYWLGCNIGFVRCYNRELSLQEVQQNYKMARERYA